MSSKIHGTGTTSCWCFERTNTAVDMPCCCDCAEIDQICDRCCRCQGVSITDVDRFFTAMQDRCRFPSCFGRGAIQVRLDFATPIILLPLGMLIATTSSFMTYFVFATFAFLLLLYYRVWKRRPLRTRTKFYYIWAMTSCILVYYLFEIIVAIYREVLFWENFMLSSMFAAMMYCIHRTRRDPGILKKSTTSTSKSKNDQRSENNDISSTLGGSGGSPLQNGRPGHHDLGVPNGEASGYNQVQHREVSDTTIPLGIEADNWCSECQVERIELAAHCPVCGVCVRRRDHHCVWIDNCVGESNHKYFFLGMVLFMLSGCYGSHLMLTTVCTPEMYYDWFLFPADCRYVYNDILSAIGYVCAFYTLISVFGMSFVFVYQVVLISQNTTSQELREAGQQGKVRWGMWVKNNSRSNGIYKNWRRFLSRRQRVYSNSYQDT